MFAVQIYSYDAATGIVTLTVTGANNALPIEYRSIGLRDWGTGNTLTIPAHQRNGYTFTLEARNNGAMANTLINTRTGESIEPSGNPTPVSPSPSPAPSPTPSPSPATSPSPAPAGNLTGETKNGFTDGDQIGFWGTYSPVFARVVNGVLYGLYIEKDPGQSASALYNLPVKKSRAWMNHIYGDDNIAAPFFAELTNQDNQAESGVTAATFQVTMSAGTAPRRPVGSGTSPVPTTTPSVIPPLTPGTATPAPTPMPGPSTPTSMPAPATGSPFVPVAPTVDPAITPATTKSTMYVLIGAAILVIALLVAAFNTK